MNKKAYLGFTELLSWLFPKGPLVLITLLVLLFLVSRNPIEVDVSSLESTILLSNLMNSQCLKFHNYREITNLIAPNKFDEATIKNCFDIQDNIGLELILKYKDKEKKILINEDLKTRSINCEVKSRFTCFHDVINVIVIEDSIVYDGTIIANMFIKNE